MDDKRQVAFASQFGKDIADLFGLKLTRKITITMEYDDFVRIDVEALLSPGDLEEFTGYMVTRKYHLVLDDEGEPKKLKESEEWPGAKVVETTRIGDAEKSYAVVVAE